MNENDCAICFEPLCSSISPIGVVNPCGHVFHRECYKQWENTNKQRQRNSPLQNRSNVQVKCPTCNTMSKGFIGMYLNLKSFNVDNASDCDNKATSRGKAGVGDNDEKVKKYKQKVKNLKQKNESLKQKAQQFNDLQKKYSDKDKKLKALQMNMDECTDIRMIDRSTIVRLQHSMNEMEKIISEKEAKNQSMKSKMERMVLRFAKKEIKNQVLEGKLTKLLEDKEREIAVLKQDREQQIKVAQKNNLHALNPMGSLKRKDGMNTASSLTSLKAACKRGNKRAIEETLEEFETNEKGKARSSIVVKPIKRRKRRNSVVFPNIDTP